MSTNLWFPYYSGGMSQNSRWASFTHGNGPTGDVNYDVATDTGGSIYVTGTSGFGASNIFNGNNSIITANRTLSNNSAYVMKFSNDGILGWRAQVSNIANTAVTTSNAVAVTSDGSTVYFVGSTGAPLGTLPTGSNVITSSGVNYIGSNINQNSAFIVALDSIGEFKWRSFLFGTGAGTNGSGVDVHSSTGYVYMTGSSGSTITSIFSNTLSNVASFSSNVNVAFLVSFDSSGVYRWRSWVDGAASIDVGTSVHVDQRNGDVFLCGYTGAVAARVYNSDDTAPNQLIIPANSAFLIKYNSSGFAQWRAYLDNTTASTVDNAFRVSVDKKGNSYLVGSASIGTMNAYNSNVYSNVWSGLSIVSASISGYVVKYDSTGLAQWRSYVDGAGVEVTRGVDADVTGNVYMTGFSGAALCTITDSTGNPSSAATTIPASSSFLAKFNNTGRLLWRNYIDNTTATEIGNAVASDNYGNPIVVGATGLAPASIFNSNVDSNCFTGISIPPLSSYIVKYDSSNGNIIDNLSNVSNYGWRCFFSNASPVFVNALGIDSDNNTYVVGYSELASLSNSNQIYESSNLYSGYNTPSNSSFLAKFDSNGNFLWRVYSYGGSGTTAGNVGSAVYVTSDIQRVFFGYYTGSSTSRLYDSDGNIVYDNLPANSSFVSLFDFDGNYKTSIYATNSKLTSVIYDIYPYVSFSGNTYGSSSTIYDFNGNTTVIPANSGFVTTIAYLGVHYKSSYISGNNDIINEIDMSSSGYLILTGSSGVGTTGVSTLFVNGIDSGYKFPQSSAFFICLQNYGESANWRSYVSNAQIATGPATGTFAAIDPLSGNTIVTGSTNASVSNIYDSSNVFQSNLITSGYILKYDTPTGKLLWRTYIGGGGAATASSNVTSNAVVVDSEGSIYVTGKTSNISSILYNSNLYGFSSNSVLINSVTPITLTNAAYISKYTADGILEWRNYIDGTGVDTGTCIVVDSDKNVYLGGYTGAGAATIYNSNTIATTRTIPANSGFVVKYNRNGNLF